MSKIFFDKIPVLEVTDEINEEFRDVVNKLQANYVKEDTMKIDSMLSDLYNLTASEREYIGYIEIS